MPVPFRQLAGINIKDRLQCIQKVFPHLRYSKGAIDYYLSHLVYSIEMKKFPDKISASGWDIGQKKTHATTGFSGTNDSRHILPLEMSHLDLPQQKHTNALVLDYLLQDEHQVIPLAQRDGSKLSDAKLILTIVTEIKPTVRVILDVGAQILELDNFQVAELWLNMVTNHIETKGVVFFNIHDELSVLDRKGHVEALQTSPYAKQLDLCLTFLDEAHTRGTDLSLPSKYRAAVTLGASLTMDRLVQACMRMRKLGHGQSIVFCVPDEIRDKILQCTRKSGGSQIEVKDILLWVILETWAELRRSIPLWARQGRRYEDQKSVWGDSRREGKYDLTKARATLFLEGEAQSLQQRYGSNVSTALLFAGWNTENGNIRCIIERCHQFACTHHSEATLQEEQERESSPETEQERQVERATPVEPAKHSIHKGVIMLVKTGCLDTTSQGFQIEL